jgi:hypothetical protein
MNLEKYFSVTDIRYFKHINSDKGLELYSTHKQVFDEVLGIRKYDMEDGHWYGYYRDDPEDVSKFEEITEEEVNREIAKIEMMRHLIK